MQLHAHAIIKNIQNHSMQSEREKERGWGKIRTEATHLNTSATQKADSETPKSEYIANKSKTSRAIFG